MSFLEALILGIIQGLTEFLPVSSGGHLELAKAIQGQDLSGSSSMMMTVVLHFATALSTIVVFRKDLLEIFKGLFQFKMNEEFMFSVKIILSMIPAALVGVMFDDIIEGLVLIGENGYGDNFGIGSDESFSILEVAKLFGGEIEMLPERKGNRMSADVITEKTRALGWSPKCSLENYIASKKAKNWN